LPRQTGLATSPDGIHWTKYDDPSTTTTLYVASDPVLKPSVGQWDGDIVMPGSVSLVGDTLHMWYTGTRSDPATYGWRIGHATSLFVPMGIRDYDDAFMPGEYLLAQNYPNPFNPVSRIRYELPQASAVSLVVYDILGREVVRLVDGYMEAGYHEVQWDGSEAASGIYFARLVTPGYSRSIKMVLLR
ncbi:MAG: T9SS type A sorting domain-containing protein, partial [Fidelibacterota bacterium]